MTIMIVPPELKGWLKTRHWTDENGISYHEQVLKEDAPASVRKIYREYERVYREVSEPKEVEE